jgi:hypothetical protein
LLAAVQISKIQRKTYTVVEPHHPLELQQVPKVDPWQVYPTVPPHVASVETFFVGVEAGAEEDRVELITRVELDRMTEDEGLLLVQVPKVDWHPVPQWSVVEPHLQMH